MYLSPTLSPSSSYPASSRLLPRRRRRRCRHLALTSAIATLSLPSSYPLSLCFSRSDRSASSVSSSFSLSLEGSFALERENCMRMPIISHASSCVSHPRVLRLVNLLVSFGFILFSRIRPPRNVTNRAYQRRDISKPPPPPPPPVEPARSFARVPRLPTSPLAYCFREFDEILPRDANGPPVYFFFFSTRQLVIRS